MTDLRRGCLNARAVKSARLPNPAVPALGITSARETSASFRRLSLALHQVLPLRIYTVYQYVFLISSPALELFFAPDRVSRAARAFTVNEFVYTISLGKASAYPVSVFIHASFDIIRNAGVQKRRCSDLPPYERSSVS